MSCPLQVRHHRRTLRAAEGKYRAGVGIFVEITEAQKAVAQARTNRVQASYNYRTARVALPRATGQSAPLGGRAR